MTKKKRKVGKKTIARKAAVKSKKTKTPVQKNQEKIKKELIAIRHTMESIRDNMIDIRHIQRAIERSVDAVMKDFIRHPLKVDGMNQQAFRALVDAAARNNPARFREDFTAKLEASDD